MINNQMLQGENNQNGVNNQEPSQVNSQQEIDDHQMTPELRENRMQYPSIKSKRRQANDQKKQLINIFYELVTLVNQHAQTRDPASSSSLLTSTNSLSQLNTSNRLVSKKKINKPPKFQILQTQKFNEHEKPRGLFFKKQSISNHRQMSSENIRKSLYMHENLNDKIPKEAGKREPIYENYSTIMNYIVHESEDEGEASPNQNFQVSKIRNHEHSMSEYSFAYSSRNLESKDRRKFSIERSVEVKVGKLIRQMKIFQQFEISMKSQGISIVNHASDQPAQCEDME